MAVEWCSYVLCSGYGYGIPLYTETIFFAHNVNDFRKMLFCSVHFVIMCKHISNRA